MLRYRVVPSSAVVVLAFPTGPVALSVGLGTPWFLGLVLSLALCCRRAGAHFIRTQDTESASGHCPFTTPECVYGKGPVAFGVFLLLVLPCFSSLLLTEASGKRVG